ncbi:MAG TPA: DNA gyrase modulator, partial [Gammaproteobacteria bacterium]|nr:DNA gyrase modulator [Gammaproteobacteria bacterium]
MSVSTAIARETLLDTPGLSEGHLTQVMDRLLSRQVDAADIYFQYGRLESWVLEDGIIKEGSHSIEQGAGLRAISGEKTGFAYTDSLELPRLLDAAGA